ncbi:hypothetical protein [Microvirga puerhi]|uniref:TIGR03067 domain-containing protein n=1 Tax=Microvirga puerhi TaxID=2876078 RepID=A0ABS7VSK8_9HYPH|nr:hypothetical protein [Microvirga puerhi]MBZ6078100.1 hypothetical protein [Microvirga puerhi]
MNKAIIAVAVFLLGSAAHAAEPFSLVGTWTGPRERLAKVEGRKEGTATLVVTEQNGRTFTGYLDRSNPEGNVKESLWGAFTPKGRLIVASDEEGIYSFDLVNRNTLDYCYVESGASARAVCARLKRQKQ